MRRLATILPFALAACSYPQFSFTPSDSGAVDTAPSADSALDTYVEPDSGEPDTSIAETAPDVADVGDATDTSDVADTRVPRGCELAHDFCANFDTVTSPSTSWTGTFSAAGGTLLLDNTTSVSSPNSLRATIPTATVTASAMLTKTITVATVGAIIRIDAEIMLPSLTYSGAQPAIMMKIQRGGSGDGVGLAVEGSTIEIVAQTDADWRTWPLSGIVAGKWSHLRIECSLHTTAGVVRAWVDDMTTPQVSAAGVPTANVDDLARQLVIGLFSYMSASSFRVHFDDVSIDVP